jgi:hypothetical protein
MRRSNLIRFSLREKLSAVPTDEGLMTKVSPSSGRVAATFSLREKGSSVYWLRHFNFVDRIIKPGMWSNAKKWMLSDNLFDWKFWLSI